MKKMIQKIVVAGVVVYRGKVLIIQRSAEEDTFPNLWEIPSGKREPFEKSQDALVREVKEETGIDVIPIMPASVFEFKVEKENELRDTTQISFLCKPIREPKIKLSEEHQNYTWISKNEIDKYGISDKIKKTIEQAFILLSKV